MVLSMYLLHLLHISVEYDGHSHWNMLDLLKEWCASLVYFCDRICLTSFLQKPFKCKKM